MYLDMEMSNHRLERVLRRAQDNVAEGLARTAEKAVAKLSGTVPARAGEVQSVLPREGERRRSGRFATGGQIHARRIPGTTFEVALDNVSAGGCRIEMMEQCEVGEDVITRFPELEAIGARVRWSLGRTSGLQFSRPIHPAVFGSLLERLMQPEVANA